MSPGSDDSVHVHGVAAAALSARDSAACDPRLAEALEAYRAELLAGRRVDRRALYERYPELASTLAQCLDALEFLQGAAQDLGHDAPTVEQVPMALPAETVLGDFRLRREIGWGGMGVVYEAEQISLHRRVAVKVLPQSAVLEPRQLQRFHNEARAAACLHHPHIVPVYAVGTERGIPYYAMQLIPGRTLAAVIASRRAQPAPAGAPALFRAVARLGIQAAQALDHAHQMGVVHRDIKPANLLVDAAGDVWVTDFGLALFQGGAGLTMTGDLVGTLRYMSPEQALGNRGYVDHRTDTYSLGVTLYEFATLRAPFPGDERAHVLRQVIEDEPLPARRANAAVPADLETILAKAMAKSPHERYATAQELADDLQRFLEDRPIRARRPALPARVLRWTRRHRPLVLSVVLSLGLLAAGALVGLFAYAQQQTQLATGWAELAQRKAEQERQARSDLFRTLTGRATALRRAREPGYRRQVWNDLRQAVALELPDIDLDIIRSEAIACLGDPVGLEPVRLPQARRVPPPELPAVFQRVLRLEFSQKPVSHAASPDGRLLATYGGTLRNERHNTEVLLWDRFGNILTRGNTLLGHAHALCFTPDSSALIAGCDEGIMRWTIAGERSPVRTGTARALAVHPGGRLLATAGRQIDLWSLNTNRLIASYPAPGAGATVEFSEHGDWLLAVLGKVATVGWKVTSTPEKQLLDGHTRGVPAVAFSPDGKVLASASKDQSLRLWDAATGRLLRHCQGHAAPVDAVAFCPDGTLVATGDIWGMIRLWDVASGRELACIGGSKDPGQVWQLQFDPAGKHLIAGAGFGLFAWSVERKGKAVDLKPVLKVRSADTSGMVYDLAVHPAGEKIVFLDRAGKLRICALAEDPQPQPLQVAARAELRGLHFDSGGTRLTYVTDKGKLGVWDFLANRALPAGPAVFHLALAPSGGMAAASSPAQGVLIYDLAAAQTIMALPSEGADVWALAWSPDATRLAVGVSDGSVAIWDLEEVRASLLQFGIALPSTRAVRANYSQR